MCVNVYIYVQINNRNNKLVCREKKDGGICFIWLTVAIFDIFGEEDFLSLLNLIISTVFEFCII